MRERLAKTPVEDKSDENKSDEELKTYTNYIKNTNSNNMVSEFCEKYILQDNNCKIEWKKIHFIWKQFLSSNNLPNVIYSYTLKNLFKERFIYDEESD